MNSLFLFAIMFPKKAFHSQKLSFKVSLLIPIAKKSRKCINISLICKKILAKQIFYCWFAKINPTIIYRKLINTHKVSVPLACFLHSFRAPKRAVITPKRELELNLIFSKSLENLRNHFNLPSSLLIFPQ